MAIVTLLLGGILMILGLVAFFATGATHYTALIPAGFGFVLDLLGAIALLTSQARKHLMHAAVILAVLGIAGTMGGVMKLPTLLGGGEVARPAAVAVQSAMAALCLVYVSLAIRSFIAARRTAAPSRLD
jgi:hypothetical protein